MSTFTGAGPYTVTLNDAVLTDPSPAAFTLEIQGEVFVERNRYEAASTWEVLSVRFPGGLLTSGGVTTQVSNKTQANPVRVVQQILTHTVWGLSQTVDTAAFDTAAALITWSVAGGLGLDRGQVTARSAITELCQLMGARVTFDGTQGAWTIAVDQASASVMSLGMGLDSPIGMGMKQGGVQAMPK